LKVKEEELTQQLQDQQSLFQAANREDVRLRLPQELLKLGLQQRKEHVRACDMTSSLL
jgi:hypothetical protein